MAKRTEDKDWVKNSFMLPIHTEGDLSQSETIFSSAFMKYTDTTPGGNDVINPPPQFTPTADITVHSRYLKDGVLSARYDNNDTIRIDTSRGMGRKYSEMIDDNNHIIHMRFGVPQYSSLTRFFTGFYDHNAAHLSRTGRAPGFFYNLGRAAGFVVSVPLLPLVWAGDILRMVTLKRHTKYYTLKPTMATYWSAVNSMVNAIAINMGVVPRVFSDENTGSMVDQREVDEKRKFNNNAITKYNDDEQYSKEDLKNFHRLLPDIFRESGGIDVYALANRSQRLLNEAKQAYEAQLEDTGTFAGMVDAVRSYVSDLPNTSYNGEGHAERGDEPGFLTYISAWVSSSAGEKGDGPDEDGNSIEDVDSAVDTDDGEGWLSRFFSTSKAELEEGGQFVSFRVNYTGTVNESVSNTIGQSEVQQKINGTSADARSKRFTIQDGNFGDGVLGSLVSGTVEAATDFAMGLADQIGFSGLAAIAGNAFADIPQVWQDSSVTLPKSTYTMELRTPYGNKLSRLINLWIPTCMILAGSLPKSTGKFSYDSPFLCELYDKGRSQVRTGIVDSIEITRGEGNIGWTQSDDALGVNISFSVVDLSSIMHMPLNMSPGLFDEDTAFNDYLATLGSLSLADQVWTMRKLQINATRKMESFRSWSSPARWGMWPTGGHSGRMLTRLTSGELF